MGKKRDSFIPEPRYHVAVWDHEGDVVECRWHATPDEVDELREKYADDPMHDVVAEEC
mgnify:CR=1 FL=1